MPLIPARCRSPLSLALAAALMAAALSVPCVPVAAQTPAAAQARMRDYDIPAQPLAAALRSYSRVSGEQVAFNSVDGDGLHSRPVHGRHSADEALAMLLEGTGLVPVRTGERTLRLEQRGRDAIMTGVLSVGGRVEPGFEADARFGGWFGIDSDRIADSAAGNGNVTDQLRVHPRVQFSRASRNGLQQGEIRPDDISLHGTRSYQNLFRLDGMVTNSDIDPVDPGNGTVIAYNSGDEQGAYLDSRLIESIQVLDANISARHGGFTGGIVDTTSRSWRGGRGGHLFLRMTDSDWNRTHVDEGLSLDSRNNGFGQPSRFQPDYRKLEYGGWAETGLTDTLGLVVGISRRDADIPMIDVGGLYYDLDAEGHLQALEREDSWKDQERRSDNLNAKLSWYASVDSALHWSLFRSDYREVLFQNGVANSGYRRNHDALGTQLEWRQQTGAGLLVARAGWRDQREERDSDRDYLVSFNDYSDWTSVSGYVNGGIGSIDSRQKTASADVSMAFDAWQFGRVTHRLELGGGLSDTRAHTDRARTFFNNTYDDYGWGDPNLRVDAFFAGRATAGYSNWYAFVEDTIEWRRFSLRPGLRLDRDDFVGRDNVAPRLAADWKLAADGSSVLTAGINRYYGRSMLTWALYAAQNAGLKHCYFGCIPNAEVFDGTWVETPDYEGLESLRTPYSDEWMLGWRTFSGPLQWELQYVDRKHRDEIRSQPKYPEGGYPQSSIREFVNDSSGMSRNASLRVSSREPLAWAGAGHELAFSLAWQESRSDTALELGYTQLDLTRNLDRSRAWFKGEIIDARDLPTSDFNAPWKASLEWRAEWAEAGVSMSHLFSWQASRTQPFRYGTGTGYATDPETGRLVAKYDTAKIEGSARWDVRLQWTPRSGHGLSLALDVNNVLDSRNQSDILGIGETVYRVYEPGRQVWASLGYDF